MRMASIAIALLFFLAVAAVGQEEGIPKATSLVELLKQVRQGSLAEEQENQRREAEFRAAEEDQRRLLEEALAAKADEEKRTERLEAEFEGNEKLLPGLQETLHDRLGTLGELFGVVRQVAGEGKSQVETSIISAQIPGRGELLGRLAQSRELPSIEELEELWQTLQEEMTEQGRVVTFRATVVTAGGEEAERPVVRIGPFNTVSKGRYLQYLSETGQLAELARQPAGRHLSTVESFEKASGALSRVAIDPSRGTILSLLIQSPGFEERVRQGGPVGYVTMVLGAIGLVVAFHRLAYLALAGRKIHAQVGSSQANPDNALGRILSVYEQHRSADVETLELKLDEAILRETPALERGSTLIKVLSVVAPLLGLLGTVTGMIETFQAITLFGTGDPKMMAGGISQALVTTVIGLVIAIPLTLLYSLVNGRSKSLIQVLEEESAGIVAEHAETLAAQRGA